MSDRLSLRSDEARGARTSTSAKGQKQTSHHARVMSVIPLEADIHQPALHVRLSAVSRRRALATLVVACGVRVK